MDYVESGFDQYLTRSIDGPQAPGNRQLNFDQLQVSGSLGDTYGQGGIDMGANSMTLNDGTIEVNDTRANNVVTLGEGKLTFKNATGKIVSQEGVLPDNSVGFRLQTPQGLGLAQFSQDNVGNTALKIAKAGYEVSKATNDQLVFNSAQNIFKIIATGTTTVTVLAGYVSGDSFFSSNIDLTNYHFTNSPAILAYFTSPSLLAKKGLALPYVHTAGTTIGYAVRYGISASNLTFEVTMGSIASAEGIYTMRYYILQETAQ